MPDVVVHPGLAIDAHGGRRVLVEQAARLVIGVDVGVPELGGDAERIPEAALGEGRVCLYGRPGRCCDQAQHGRRGCDHESSFHCLCSPISVFSETVSELITPSVRINTRAARERVRSAPHAAPARGQWDPRVHWRATRTSLLRRGGGRRVRVSNAHKGSETLSEGPFTPWRRPDATSRAISDRRSRRRSVR
jgi:hypothetical protein